MILDRPVLVTGSREWRDPMVVGWVLKMFPAPGRLRHGDAPGLDRMAAEIAEDKGWIPDPFPADWDQYGNEAGHRRNLRMAMTEPIPWLCVAFPLQGSVGTWDQILICDERGIPTVIYGVEGWRKALETEILKALRT